MTMTTLPVHGERPDLGEIPAEPVKRVGRPPGSKNQQNAHRDAERAHKRTQDQARRDRYAKQEAKRASQFQIDQPGTLFLLVGLAAFTFLTTAVLTADGTIGSSVAARFAFEWMGFLLFGAFEVAILAFMLMYYVLGSRINIETGEREKATRWFVAMVAVSALTVLLSAYHVLDLYDYDWLSIDMWFGIGIRLAVSTLFVLVSKGISGVLFARAVRL